MGQPSRHCLWPGGRTPLDLEAVLRLQGLRVLTASRVHPLFGRNIRKWGLSCAGNGYRYAVCALALYIYCTQLAMAKLKQQLSLDIKAVYVSLSCLRLAHASPDASHLTLRTWPRPCLLRPRFLRFLDMVWRF